MDSAVPPSTSGAPGRRPRPPVLPWWGWILVVDAILIVFTVAPWPRVSGSPVFDALATARGWLNLSTEQNIAVWWSGALMFLAAALLYEHAGRLPASARRPWVALALLSLGLSVDEVASVHERLSEHGGWPPLIVIGLVALGVLGWALYQLAWVQGERGVALLLASAYLCYGSIGLQEYLEHNRDWTGWVLMRLAVEEGTELVGSLLAMLAAVRARGPLDPRLRALAPRPDRLPTLGRILAVGLAVHVVVAVGVVPRLHDWHWRGNPSAWYPAAVYGLAACAAFWTSTAPGVARRWPWRLLAGLFVLASVDAVFDLVVLVPGVHRVLPRSAYQGFYTPYLFVTAPVALIGFGSRLLTLDRRGGLVLAGLVAPLFLWELGGGWPVELAAPGFLALVWAAGLGFAGAAAQRQAGMRRPGF